MLPIILKLTLSWLQEMSGVKAEMTYTSTECSDTDN